MATITLKQLINELNKLSELYEGRLDDQPVLVELSENIYTEKLGSFCLVSGAEIDGVNAESGITFISGQMTISNEDLIERIQDFTAFRQRLEPKEINP